MRPRELAHRLRAFIDATLAEFPWEIRVTDWTGAQYGVGQGRPHWREAPLDVHIRTTAAGRDLLSLNALGFLERFVDGEIDFNGNLYLLSDIRCHARLRLSSGSLVRTVLANRALLFQTASRARRNVKSHYDIPQEALNTYLDRRFMSYSCAMFERPEELDCDELTRPGTGKLDNFDSLEKAQWRKFNDAVEFIEPQPGETLLDIGCGYGGQLYVALEERPAFGKVVGWTHSSNQVLEGRWLLAQFDPGLWELNEGDYRQEMRTFDHVTSTGMVSHVGPSGLIPYVRRIRRLIRTGGRYVHHALMTPHMDRPLDSDIGVAFNKKYVWPGFHWFTLGQHVNALERNGFEVTRAVNLSPHYAKTTAAWYERMMQNRTTVAEALGEKTFRAWQIYLSGASSGFLNRSIHVYRLYCTAV